MSKLFLAVMGMIGAGLLLQDKPKVNHPILFLALGDKEIVVGAAQEITFKDIGHYQSTKITRLRFSSEIHDTDVFYKGKPISAGGQRLALCIRMPDGQVYKNVWFSRFSPVYSSDNWIIIDEVTAEAKRI